MSTVDGFVLILSSADSDGKAMKCSVVYSLWKWMFDSRLAWPTFGLSWLFWGGEPGHDAAEHAESERGHPRRVTFFCWFCRISPVIEKSSRIRIF